MRKFLMNSGLTTVILTSVAAVTFLPKNAAQLVVIGSIVIFGISKLVIYCSNHENEIKQKLEKHIYRVKNRKVTPGIPLEFKYAVNQLSHRVTEILHAAFPGSTWYWTDKPTAKLFTDGGRIRITTSKTEDFNEADVILDTYGRIEIKMLKSNSVSEIVRVVEGKEETAVDTRKWFEECGQKILTDIITDLNARGTKVLCNNEDGSIIIDDDKQVGTLKAFPNKNLWDKLIDIFEENGLTAVETENSIRVGW